MDITKQWLGVELHGKNILRILYMFSSHPLYLWWRLTDPRTPLYNFKFKFLYSWKAALLPKGGGGKLGFFETPPDGLKKLVTHKIMVSDANRRWHTIESDPCHIDKNKNVAVTLTVAHLYCYQNFPAFLILHNYKSCFKSHIESNVI